MTTDISMNVETGIPAEARDEIAAGLSRLLADTYALYLRTHAYHWNVSGAMFFTLHSLFEMQYLELRDAVDPIAERILALGHRAPGSYGEFADLSSIPDEAGVPAPEQMVRRLVEMHETLIRAARPLAREAGDAGDVVSADLVTRRLEAHEKMAWMLRATAA
jgi:starvation-inducible DNA-binding protein